MRDTTTQAERLQAISLRYSISTHFENQGIAATNLPAAELVRLLTRRQWRKGNLTALNTIVGRLGFDVRLEGLGLLMREEKGP